MKRTRLRNFLLIAALIAATGAAMAYSSNLSGVFSMNQEPVLPQPYLTDNGILRVSGQLNQNKVLQGSDGLIGFNLTLQAENTFAEEKITANNIDMVIVLDRSGSMKGRKITDARQAVRQLLSRLSAADRFALVTYSDGVRIDSGLLKVTPNNRRNMELAVSGIQVGGGTNLGAGLQAGIDLLESSQRGTNAARIILISDGLANKGITDARTLSSMAGIAVEKEFAVSTVGVGIEFNEYLMSAIADQGTGSYYYLENPEAFAEVFQKEFNATRMSVVSNLKIQIPLKDGISLVNAAGYPIRIQDGYAVFHPGSLRSGQTRKIYLTLRVPTLNQKDFELDDIKIGYQHNHAVYETTLEHSYKIACVGDRRKVLSSIDKTGWSEKVINEDFNRLKQEVAAELKSGEKKEALNRIRAYRIEKREMNTYIQSAGVAKNLDKDLKELEMYVEDTFKGAPEAVRQKQKSNAKALQFDGYRGRRQ